MSFILSFRLFLQVCVSCLFVCFFISFCFYCLFSCFLVVLFAVFLLPSPLSFHLRFLLIPGIFLVLFIYFVRTYLVSSQVRARFDGDEARLLSGEFPFRSTPTAKTNTNADSRKHPHSSGAGGAGGRDHGDPRTRCSVALDVSLMPDVPREGTDGQRLGGGGNGDLGRGGGGLVRFSCFVHRVSDVSSGSSGSRESRAADARVVGTTLERLRPVQGVCVDALFKHDTRRAVDLCPGSQLRIYDPCCVWNDASAGGRALLVCTQLCEPFPASLPPLPSPGSCITTVTTSSSSACLSADA